MKITKSELQQVIREALEEEMGMYEPEMSVEGLMEVIKDLDEILLDIFLEPQSYLLAGRLRLNYWLLSFLYFLFPRHFLF